MPFYSLPSSRSLVGGSFVPGGGGGPADWTNPTETIVSDSTPVTKQYYGYSTSVDGDTIAVGSPGEFFGTSYAGRVFVYKKTSGNWSLQATLQPSDSDTGDSFGISVAIQGDTIVVGSYLGPRSGSNANQGRVTVFVRSGSTWSQQQIISAPSPVEYGYLGFHVSLDNDSLVASEISRDKTNPNTGANQNNAGTAYVYTRSGSTWSLQQEIDFGEPDHLATRQEAQLGTATAIKGDWMALHNLNYRWGDASNGGAGTGCVYLYKRTGTTWAWTQTLIGADATHGDGFGYDIKFSGDPADTLICGMNGGGGGPGFSYVYTRTGNTWTSRAKLQASDHANNDFHGRTVELSDEGNVALVGSPWDVGQGGWNTRGSVYIWTTTDPTKITWTQVKKLEPSQNSNFMRFGMNTINMSGDVLVIPAYNETVSGNAGAGKIYIYDRVTGGGGGSSAGSPDISTASYSTNFDTANETTETVDLQFNSDGSKLFVACNSTNKIYRYTTSNYSIASASYDSVSKDLSGTFATNINAFIFNGDGTSFYILGNDQGGTTPDTIYQFDMSTAYDIVNASYTKQGTTVQTGLTTAVDNTPDKMIFNNDGTKVYITGRSTNQMYQFSLSTAYDISTISYDSVNMPIGVNTNYRAGMQWGHNGRKLYIIDGEGQTPLSLDMYTFTTPYDISTSGFNSSIDISGNGLTRPQGLALKPDGTGFIILDGHKTFATAKLFEFTTSAIAGGTPGENTGVTHSFGGGLVLSWSVEDDNVQTSERTLTNATLAASAQPGDVVVVENSTIQAYNTYNNLGWQLRDSGTLLFAIKAVNGNDLTILYAQEMIYRAQSTTTILNRDLKTYFDTASNERGDIPASATAGFSYDFSANGTTASQRWLGGTATLYRMFDSTILSAWDTSDNNSNYQTPLPDVTGDFTPLWSSSGGGGASAKWYGDRAVNGGGQANEATYSTVIEYAAIATGNAFSDFGDLTVGKIELDACSSPTYGLFWGGYGGGTRQEIDYITIATTGNAADFGDMSHASYWGGACSSGTRGCHYGTGAWDGSANVQNIDYVTIATPGNAADFGDIGSSPGIGFALKAVSNGTRGLWGGGFLQSPSDQQNVAIYYITFDTLGNGTSFGNLTQGSYRVSGAASDATYGLWAGGDTGPTNYTQQTGIEYITMSTPGNSTDFGDLTAQKRYINGTNNATRAIFMGGLSSASSVDYVTIQTPGNATAWGDLSQTNKKNFGSCSGDA